MKYLSSSLLVLVVASFLLVGATTTIAETRTGEQQGIVKCGTKKVDGDGNPVYSSIGMYDCSEEPYDNGQCNTKIDGSGEWYSCKDKKEDGGCYKLIQTENDPCGFSDLGTLILDITQKIIYQFAPLLVIVMITVGGFSMLVAREDPGLYQKGWQFIKYALIGYIIVLLAFLIVETFLKIMGVDTSYGITQWWNILGGDESIFGT